jgi:predicted nucleotide-binding protein
LAKERRFDDRLLFSCPLIKVEKADHEWAFASLANHYRYLWQMNITLDCSGATEYEPGIQDSLGKIRPPEHITLEHKARRLVIAGHLQPGTERQWIMKVKRQLARYVTTPEETIKFERIFISCSWDDNEYGEPRPHGLALKIRDWIFNDISREEPNLQPIIVQGNPGERLSDTLFNLLDTSTLGVFLLTDDIQLRDENGQIVERMSRNNVYHELGYLMRSLESNKKIFIGLEVGVKLASNLTNSIYRPIKSKARLKESRKGSENSDVTIVQAFHLYLDILDWLRKESALLRHETFCDALSQHEQRLRENAELLTSSDQTDLSNKLKEMREISCTQNRSL